MNKNQHILKAEAAGAFAAKVYTWMAIGLGITAGITAMLFGSGLSQALMPFWPLWTIGLLAVSLSINFAINRCSERTITGLFILYAVLEGLVMGTVLPAYAAAYGGGLIWVAFVTACSLFTITAIYGSITKADLTQIGKLLNIGLIGLFAVSLIFMVVSFFVHMPILYLFICYIGLALFTGLTAYDAQNIRRISAMCPIDSPESRKATIILALKMYVNVVMIFWYILQILSSNKKR